MKAVITAEEVIFPELKKVKPGMCFQLLGTDVDLDTNYHPWILESNINPTIDSMLSFERDSKFEMLRRVFTMVKITESPKELAKQQSRIRRR